MKTVKGDLIKMAQEGKFDIIAHGCNCFCNMGSGIAATIRREYPGAYNIDQRTEKGSKKKLGTFSSFSDGQLTILNMYTQFSMGRNKVHADYKAIRSCMKLLKMIAPGKRVGLPLIGCGLAGGDWSIVEKIIEEELAGEDVTIVLFD